MKTTGELIHTALVMYRNYLETHNVNLSASDAIRAKQNNKIQPLDSYQKKMVCKLESLIELKLKEIEEDEVV